MKRCMRRYLSGLFSPHRAAALVWAVCLLTGCTAEETDEWTSDGRTTSVTLRVPMAETLTTRTTDAEYATDEEKIKTLRILVFSQDKPVINEAFNEAELSDGSVTITGVPVGTVTFYAVANEEALGKDYSDMSNFENNLVEVNGVKKAWVKDEEDPKHFPLRFTDPQVKKYGLPMSWVQRDMTIEPPGAEPQEIEVELRRCVAKLNVIMSNTLSDPITITEMRFGEFFGDQLYLFGETFLDVPEGTDYGVKTYSEENIEIKGYGSKTLACYIYPSYAWQDPTEVSPYTIGFSTASGQDYSDKFFIDEYNGRLNSIPRNKQVNIYATLSSAANLTIKFEVVEWTKKDITVPPFN